MSTKGTNASAALQRCLFEFRKLPTTSPPALPPAIVSWSVARNPLVYQAGCAGVEIFKGVFLFVQLAVQVPASSHFTAAPNLCDRDNYAASSKLSLLEEKKRLEFRP